MKKSGEITVFLALVLSILISLLFTVIQAARTNAMRFQTECVTDMALQSVLAEYNRELLEQYELFFIDAAYGTMEESNILLEEHIREYLEKNFNAGGWQRNFSIKDLLELQIDFAEIEKSCGAADDMGGVLERRAAEYMLERYGLDTLLQKFETEDFETESLFACDMKEMRKENETAIRRVDTTVTDSDGKKHRIPVKNPADKINRRRGSSEVLRLMTEGKELSKREFRAEEYLSARSYLEQDGFLPEERTNLPFEENLFRQYLMEKCGNYVHPKDSSYLTYQMEYLLAGKDCDVENLQTVTERILALREASNFIYLLSDSEKQAEAEAMAMTLAAVILFPELAELIKFSILIAWAYAESVNDVKTLLGGGSVPLYKSRSDWRLGLESALSLNLPQTEKSQSGLSYEEYLHIFLLTVKREERNKRFMDLVEMDIRQTEGNENFCINHCVDSFIVQIQVRSAKGGDCLITRTAGYWK